MKKIGFKKLLLALMLLSTFATADTVVNKCNTGFECNKLGVAYGKGDGVKKDYAKASELLKKACSLGYKAGCFNEGTIAALEMCKLSNKSNCDLVGHKYWRY